MDIHRIEYSPLKTRGHEGGPEIRLLRVKARYPKDAEDGALPGQQSSVQPAAAARTEEVVRSQAAPIPAYC